MSTIDSAATGIAVQQAIARRDVSISLVKQAANQDRAVANLIEEAANNAAALSGRGGNVNFTV